MQPMKRGRAKAAPTALPASSFIFTADSVHWHSRGCEVTKDRFSPITFVMSTSLPFSPCFIQSLTCLQHHLTVILTVRCAENSKKPLLLLLIILSFSLIALLIKQVSKLVHCFLMHRWEYMAINVEGCCNVAMTKQFLDDFRMHTFGK